MSQILELFNFKSAKERDDFIIALLVLAFFIWLFSWLMFPKLWGSDVEANIPNPSDLNPVAMLDADLDSDNDGIPDEDDDCIHVYGETPNGCPSDKDGDGVYDKEDDCPSVKGVSENAGCPSDKDRDGIYDYMDKCPDLEGEKENDGCPFDKDGDGIADKLDECPDRAGTKANKGCPEIKLEEEERKLLEEAIQAVEFETGSATLKRTSRSILYRIAKTMNKYPDYKLDIIGHTDNQGEPASNMTLSIDRAKSCLDYLITQGVDEERINSKGYGENRPIESNETEEGRSKNRRVEFNLRY